VPVEEITAPFKGELDPRVVALLEHSFDRMPWRLYIHQPYTHWSKGKVCVMGDAAHPMMPNQSQGAVQAIEDAAALGIVFSDTYRYDQDVEAGLRLYERVRKPRATRVQQASLRATENQRAYRLFHPAVRAEQARLDWQADDGRDEPIRHEARCRAQLGRLPRPRLR